MNEKNSAFSKFKSNKVEDIDESYYDTEIDSIQDTEYLGPTNQIPLASQSFRNNFTMDIYAMWNKFYYPFNAFPVTPFEVNPTIQDRYFKIEDHYSVQIDVIRFIIFIKI